MSKLLTFTCDVVVPDRNAVFMNQGIPAGAAVREVVDVLYCKAIELFRQAILPAGLMTEISKLEFSEVYRGEGLNEPLTPVGDIYGQADRLALFAVTLGERISHQIEECFKAGDFALGVMLDSVASAGADRLADIAQHHFVESPATRTAGTDAVQTGRGAMPPLKTSRCPKRVPRNEPDTSVMRYSPGYCGWHASGQKQLFSLLRPDRIGISLTKSFMMHPLKSISGVMVAGSREIHCVGDDYPFCSRCDTHACRERIRQIVA